MDAARVLAAFAMVTICGGPAIACPGDCDGDRDVSVAELITGVRIALGQTAANACDAVDSDESGSVDIAELIAVVRAALSGCPPRLTFAPPRRYPTGDSPRSLAIAGLDGDEWPGIVGANHGSDDVSVLLNDQHGGFLSEVRYPVGMIPLGIAVADFNGDQHADLATANGRSGDVSILLGRGDGTFMMEPAPFKNASGRSAPHGANRGPGGRRRRCRSPTGSVSRTSNTTTPRRPISSVPTAATSPPPS